MNFLHYDLNIGVNDVIEVTLDKQANVRLLDNLNFNNYKHGKKYVFFGGAAKTSPITIRPPHPGSWYLVIDLGGFQGTVKASVRVIKQ